MVYVVKLRMLLHCNNTDGFGQVVIVMMGVERRHMERVMFARQNVFTEIHVNTTEAIFTMCGMNATSLESTQSIDFTSCSQEEQNDERQTYEVGQTLIALKTRPTDFPKKSEFLVCSFVCYYRWQNWVPNVIINV
jgi:hypothetical protein